MNPNVISVSIYLDCDSDPSLRGQMFFMKNPALTFQLALSSNGGLLVAGLRAGMVIDLLVNQSFLRTRKQII